MKKRVVIVVFVAVLILAAGYGFSRKWFLSDTPDNPALSVPVPTFTPSTIKTPSIVSTPPMVTASVSLSAPTSQLPADALRQKIAQMPLKDKIGQMVITGVIGYEMDNNAKSLIQENHIGGVVILGENVKDARQLSALTNALKQANAGNEIPLFLSIDEEGGRIERMPAELKRYPTNQSIGKTNNGTFSYQIGQVIAKEISAFGFNMDNAPVLDINSNPNNPVIGDRSFGDNPQIVQKLGIQTMKGIRSVGVIPVVKHFPGHGDTSTDSHVGLPVVNNDLQRLKSFELLPFAEAIRNGADVVMIAHILLPKLDPEAPSSLSKAIITGVLRQEMGFDGVVVTDDLTMGAIVSRYSIGQAVVKSVFAGSDILLVAHQYKNTIEAINALTDAVNNNVISTSRIDESVYRILKLKQKYRINDKAVPPVDVQKINHSIEAVLKKFGAR